MFFFSTSFALLCSFASLWIQTSRSKETTPGARKYFNYFLVSSFLKLVILSIRIGMQHCFSLWHWVKLRYEAQDRMKQHPMPNLTWVLSLGPWWEIFLDTLEEIEWGEAKVFSSHLLIYFSWLKVFMNFLSLICNIFLCTVTLYFILSAKMYAGTFAHAPILTINSPFIRGRINALSETFCMTDWLISSFIDFYCPSFEYIRRVIPSFPSSFLSI